MEKIFPRIRQVRCNLLTKLDLNNPLNPVSKNSKISVAEILKKFEKQGVANTTPFLFLKLTGVLDIGKLILVSIRLKTIHLKGG